MSWVLPMKNNNLLFDKKIVTVKIIGELWL